MGIKIHQNPLQGYTVIQIGHQEELVPMGNG